jgi:sensor histidine kinase YesM
VSGLFDRAFSFSGEAVKPFLIEQLRTEKKTDAQRRLLYFQHGRPEISGANRTVSALKHKTPGLFFPLVHRAGSRFPRIFCLNFWFLLNFEDMLRKKINIPVVLVHILCWIIVLLIPSISAISVIINNGEVHTKMFFAPIISFSLILISIFYFNYYFLIPRLLFRGKRFFYVLSCIGIVLLVLSVPFIITQVFHYEPEDVSEAMKRTRPLAFSNLILLFLMALISSIGLAMNNRLKQTEKEKLTAQLAYLQSQVNPHFLFNTLNGIYAVTISKAPKAAEMVEKLAVMMRYSLQQTPQETVELAKEIEYLNNYIELQKIRFGDAVNLNCSIYNEKAHWQITPLLLIPFIENAFKYGVNTEEDSHIDIRLQVSGSTLLLDVFNKKVNLDLSTHVKSGLGISNTRNRLQLIYPNKHALQIADTEKGFRVSLQIELA